LSLGNFYLRSSQNFLSNSRDLFLVSFLCPTLWMAQISSRYPPLLLHGPKGFELETAPYRDKKSLEDTETRNFCYINLCLLKFLHTIVIAIVGQTPLAKKSTRYVLLAIHLSPSTVSVSCSVCRVSSLTESHAYSRFSSSPSLITGLRPFRARWVSNLGLLRLATNVRSGRHITMSHKVIGR